MLKQNYKNILCNTIQIFTIFSLVNSIGSMEHAYAKGLKNNNCFQMCYETIIIYYVKTKVRKANFLNKKKKSLTSVFELKKNQWLLASP